MSREEMNAHQFQEGRFSQKVLNAGFFAALVLAGVCLVGSMVYLASFLYSTQAAMDDILTKAATTNVNFYLVELAVNARMVTARIALLSCGITVGMSFGFLGFALFLIGVKGEMDVEAQNEKYSVKIARMAPGGFVILCAVVLIAVCVTRSTPFSYTRTPAPQQVMKQSEVDLPDGPEKVLPP